MDPMSLLLLMVAFIALFYFMNRSQKKRQQQAQEQMAAMEPGTWVMTTTGFYGRLIDIDGDVAILETADGTETYWLKQALRGPSQPPFASDNSEDSDTNNEQVEDSDISDSDINEPSNETKNDGTDKPQIS